jgi:hypothetical protein
MDLLKSYQRRIIEAIGLIVFMATLFFTILVTAILTFKMFGISIH